MNILKILIIAIIFAISVLVISFNPKMHKQVRLEEANFDLAGFVSSQKAHKEEPKPPSNTIQNTAKKAKVIAETPQPSVPETIPSSPIPAKAPSQAMPQVKEPQKPQPHVGQLTAEQEEIIAWNKWRSDLQNQTMRDAHLIAPVGTKFSFSFTVDKFGNISNLRIWADPPLYTGLGMRVIRPILMSYQGQPILNFPPQSKRIVVNIQGGFSMARTSKYSSPSDYSDYERVK